MNPNDQQRPDDRQLNPSGKPPLSEKNFIQNGWSFFSLPFWLWLSLFVTLAALFWGTRGWYDTFLKMEKRHDRFLEVTNRDFSVFLWQFPSFLRVNVPQKTGYLPAFQSTSENFDPSQADAFVSAPPDLIFLYHTWHRLLSPETSARPIRPSEFEDFLTKLPEWQPQNWSQAPQEYKNLVDSQDYKKIENLQTLPETALPRIIRQAFQGWKNYFIEGARINELRPTFGQIKAFLEHYPNYARNYWRNIDQINGQEVAGPNYLLGFLNQNFVPNDPVPNEQLAPFLKVALFNAEQAKEAIP